jgi:hypothetical protein
VQFLTQVMIMANLDSLPVSQSLTVIAPGQRDDAPKARSFRPESGFLAQIIASQIGMIQYRARRRATPGHAIAAYAAANQAGRNSLSVAA